MLYCIKFLRYTDISALALKCFINVSSKRLLLSNIFTGFFYQEY